MRPSRTALVLLVLLARPGAAPAQDAPTDRVIPAGQDALFASMLRDDHALPGDCRWDGASVQPTEIRSRYICSAGPVEVLLNGLTHAPAGSVRTAQFALHIASGAPPPGFLQALAARIRARESTARWVNLAPPHGAATRSVSSARGFARHPGKLLGLIALFVAVASFLALRRTRSSPGATKLPSAALIRRARAPSTVVASAAVLVVALHLAARAVGAALAAEATRQAGATLAWSVPVALVAVTLSLASVRVLSLAPRARALGACLAAAVLYALGWVHQIPPSDPSRFGRLTVYPPGKVFVERMAARPAVTYRINALGFREPGFSMARAAGTVRVAIVGDSFVFGMGVGLGDTLSSQLARELGQRHGARAVEVLNLGIPGDNLASHVDLYSEAVERLAPDLVVLCLTLPNDLSHWDFQSERREATRPGPFSLARFALGGAATVSLWDLALLQTEVTPEGLDELRRETARLTRLRHTLDRRPPLFVLVYGTTNADIVGRLQSVPRSTLVTAVYDPADYIPGDGHPNASGNLHSSTALADAFDSDPATRAILAGP